MICRALAAGALALALASCETVPGEAPDGGAGGIDLPEAQSSPLDRSIKGATKGPTALVQGPLGELNPLSDTFDSEESVEKAEIFRGTGVLARRPARSRSEVNIIEDGDITLNFANAEIREVVDAVLGQALGLSYIIDPRVQGEVTARTSRPIPRQAVIPALENAAMKLKKECAAGTSSNATASPMSRVVSAACRKRHRITPIVPITARTPRMICMISPP